MIQKIKVYHDEDPFGGETVEVEVAQGEKIMSNDPNVVDMYKMYTEFEEGRPDNKDLVKQMNGDCVVSGHVISKSETEAFVDTRSKETIYVNLEKEDPRYLDYIRTGEEIKLYVKPRKSNNTLEGSYSNWVEKEKIKEVVDSIGNKTHAYEATVKELIHGGYYLSLDGIEVFMPGSLGGMNKLHDFEKLLGKKIVVMPVNYSKDKGTIVVSHREYLKTLVPSAIEDLKERLDEELTGQVTGTISNGVFVEFNQCLTGLISAGDLCNEDKEKFDKRSIKPGQDISFKVKQIVSDRKIVLTQKESLSEAWGRVEDALPPASITKGRVTKIAPYGAFIEIERGVSGLLHSSDTKDHDLKEGDIIEVKIQKIDAANKKINLKLANTA